METVQITRAGKPKRLRRNYRFTPESVRILERLKARTGYTETQVLEAGLLRLDDYFRERDRGS